MVKQVSEFNLNQQESDLLDQLKDKVNQNSIKIEIQAAYPGKSDEIFYSEDRLVRFLFAREMNVEKASQMWFDWAKWYIEQRPERITKEEIQEEIDAKKAFWFKQDNKKNPCLIVMIKNHIPVYEKIEQSRKFFLWSMEQGIQMAKNNGTHRLTIIWDGKGFQKSQMNSAFLDFIKVVAKSLQDYYPCRLAALYVTDPDFIFRLGYALLKPFLSKVITSKIHQIPMKDLNKYFDADCILPEHGGDANQISPLSPDYVQINQRTNNFNQSFQNILPQQNNHLNVENFQSHHSDNHHNNQMNNSFITEEFYSIANDTKIFFDNQSLSQFKLNNHENRNQQNLQQEILIEGSTNQTKSLCCSTDCSIF
ncbi:hypothetical protein ABPG72_008317 [Tetrahymena utriculariae]